MATRIRRDRGMTRIDSSWLMRARLGRGTGRRGWWTRPAGRSLRQAGTLRSVAFAQDASPVPGGGPAETDLGTLLSAEAHRQVLDAVEEVRAEPLHRSGQLDGV